MSEMKFCAKCNRYSCEKGSGAGRQYRCHLCTAARLKAMQKRQPEPQRQAA